MIRIDEILDRFEWVRQDKDQWRAKCPAHETHHRSLVISLGEKGVLFHCYAGCENQAILDAVGLDWQDVFYSDDPLPLSSKKPIRRASDRAPWMSREQIEYEYDYGTMPEFEYLERLLAWSGRRTLVEFDDGGEVTRYSVLRYEREAEPV